MLTLAMNGELKNTTSPNGTTSVEACISYSDLLSGPGPQGIPVLVLEAGSSGVIVVNYTNTLGSSTQDQVYHTIYEPSANFYYYHYALVDCKTRQIRVMHDYDQVSAGAFR